MLEFIGKMKSHACSKAGIDPAGWYNIKMNFTIAPSERVYFVPIDYVQEAITALFQKPVCNQAYHITGDSPLTTLQIENTIARVLRLDGLTVGTEKVFEEQDDRLMGRFLGDLYPYFKGDIIFDQSNVRRDLGDKVLDWTYGVQGLEKLIRSFFVDYFPNVDWIQQLATTEPDREPKRSGN